MAIKKNFREDVELSHEWNWTKIQSLHLALKDRTRLQLRNVSVETPEGDAESESLEEIVREFALIGRLDDVTLWYETEGAAKLSAYACWQPRKPRSWFHVAGSDEAEVLGLARLVQRLDKLSEPDMDIDTHEQAAVAPATEQDAMAPAAKSVESTSPLWQQGWFWGAMTAVIGLAAIVVAIIVSGS